jgi:hypothetical protein
VSHSIAPEQYRFFRLPIAALVGSVALSSACAGGSGSGASAGAANSAGFSGESAGIGGGAAGSAGASSGGASAAGGPSNAGSGGIPSGAGDAAGGNAGSGTSNAGSGGASGGASNGGGGATAAGGVAGMGGSSGAVGFSAPQSLIVYDDSNGRLLYVNNANPSVSWTSNSGTGRDLQLVGGGRVMLGKSDGWDEYQLSNGAKASGQHGFAGTQDAYRLANGNTMLASVSGTSIVLKMVNGSGQTQSQITYPGYSYVRLVRPTSAGTYLVTADSVVFEGNDQGAVLWHVSPVGARHVWKAMRLANGNTAITTGYGATLVIYDSAGKLLQTMGGTSQANAAQIAPWFYADFHVLPSGNYFLVNSQADRTMDNSIQLLEYDPSGTLVWKQKQPTGVRTLEEAIILDGLDTSRLNVEPQGQLISAP